MDADVLYYCTTNAVFNVTLTPAAVQDVSVNYATSDGTAAGADYVATAGTLTILAGATSETISVPVNGETIHEYMSAAEIAESLRSHVRSVEGTHLELDLHKDRDSVVAVINALTGNGIEVIDVSTQRADLEDVFVDLIHRQRS